MNAHVSTFSTPLGPFSIAVTADGSIIATAFGNGTALQRRLKKCHVLRDTSPGERAPGPAAQRTIQRAEKQIAEYLSGARSRFDLPLAPEGSAFQKRVWAALQEIPHGETRSYGELARSLRTAARAVGRANATNPVCLFVPCHRVIGADRSLTGFAFGEAIKRRLLEHEGVSLAKTSAS